MTPNQSLQNSAFSWLLQHSNDLIISLTSQGDIIHISHSVANLYHWDAKNIIGMNYFKQLEQQGLVPPISLDSLNKMKGNCQLIQAFDMEQKSDLHVVEWFLSYLDIPETADRIYLFLGKDITRQHQAEQQAKSTQLSLEHIVAIMPGNVYWMDKNLVYLGCNQNAAALIGAKSVDEVIGKTYEDFARTSGWGEGRAESFKRDDLAVISTKRPKLNVEEPPIQHPDGRMINYLTSRVPILDENEEVVGVVGLSIDITARKKIEAELLKAKEQAELANKEKLLLLEKLNKEVVGYSARQYETVEEYAYSIRHHLMNIISCMPGNVYWLDKNLVYLGCNQNVARFINIKSPSEIIGKTYEDFVESGVFSKEIAISFAKDDQEVLLTGNPKLNVEEPPIISPEGKLTHFLTSRVPIRDEHNNVTGVVGISIDITELKETQAELKKAEARIEGMVSLSASIAHELRTPLSAIQIGIRGVKMHFPTLVEGYAAAKEHQLVKPPYIQPKQLQILTKMFDKMETETQYSNTIIDMILVNVRQSGISSASFKEIEISDCVEEALTRYPFKEEETQLIEWKKEDDFSFMGDEMLMVHVLFNLIRNALYYIEAEKKGHIEIWYGADESSHILYFKDTAKGIPSDLLPRLFEKFHTTRRHGTGLGLAYCKMVMEAFGGSIDCQSEYGQFTQFEMRFPKVCWIKKSLP